MSTASRWSMDLGIRVAKVLGWIVAAIIALMGYIYFFGGPYEHRFRLTFDVTVDGQVKQGTGVISVFDTDMRWYLLAYRDWSRKSRGPSPWIDLGSHGVLAVAIHPNAFNFEGQAPYPAGRLSFVAFYGADMSNPKITADTVLGIRTMTGRRKLPPDIVQFVWFPDPGNPSSAIFLPPASTTNLAAKGIELGALTVEITEDQPDETLFAKLPWLRGLLDRELQSPTPQGPGKGLHVMNLLGDIF